MVSRRVADRWSAYVPTTGGAALPMDRSETGRVFGSVEYQDDYDPYLLLDLSYPEPALAG